MSPARDDDEDYLGDFGPIGALPVVAAFWLLVGAAYVLGRAVYHALLAGAL